LESAFDSLKDERLTPIYNTNLLLSNPKTAETWEVYLYNNQLQVALLYFIHA
jgi:hypothetical protein